MFVKGDLSAFEIRRAGFETLSAHSVNSFRSSLSYVVTGLIRPSRAIFLPGHLPFGPKPLARGHQSFAYCCLRPAAFHIDRLAEQGPAVRMPHSRSLGEGLFELRFFYLDRIAQRITYFFAGEGRLVLLTEFRKQRTSERGEIARARAAMARCIREGHTAEEDDR